jgi:flagellar basal-body rod protein FlgG
MQRALWTAASGMTAQQLNIDTIANNLANANTTGFKRARARFEDLLYQTLRAPGSFASQRTQYPAGIQLGLGTRPAAVEKLYSQGDLKKTDNPLDLVIQGDGFFKITLPDGTTGYTRDGAFALDRDGQLVNAEGYALEPAITIPQGTVRIEIGADGTVTSIQNGQTSGTQVGSVELASFLNPSGLRAMGGNMLTPTDASGDPTFGPPGESGLGTLAQGFLEVSNISVVNELVDMIAAQRAYEMNSKAVKTSDEMLSQVNALIR